MLVLWRILQTRTQKTVAGRGSHQHYNKVTTHSPVALHANFSSTRNPAAHIRPSTRPRLAPLGLALCICGHRAHPTDITLDPTTTAVALDIQLFGSNGNCTASTACHTALQTLSTRQAMVKESSPVNSMNRGHIRVFFPSKYNKCQEQRTEKNRGREESRRRRIEAASRERSLSAHPQSNA